MKIKNEHGVEIDYDVAVNMMDDDLREDLHARCFGVDEQGFFQAYCNEHRRLFDEEFELNKPNPVY